MQPFMLSDREVEEIDRARITDLLDREGEVMIPRPVVRRPLSVRERDDRPFVRVPQRAPSPYDLITTGKAPV